MRGLLWTAGQQCQRLLGKGVTPRPLLVCFTGAATTWPGAWAAVAGTSFSCLGFFPTVAPHGGWPGSRAGSATSWLVSWGNFLHLPEPHCPQLSRDRSPVLWVVVTTTGTPACPEGFPGTLISESRGGLGCLLSVVRAPPPPALNPGQQVEA